MDEEPAREEAICPRSWDGSRPSWKQGSPVLAPGVRAHATRLPLPRTKHKHRAGSCPGPLLDLVCLPRVGVQNPEEESGGGKRVREEKKRGRGGAVSKPPQALGPLLTEALFGIT